MCRENFKNNTKMRTKEDVIVHLRENVGKDGTRHLYLHVTRYGKRTKESLHMSLSPGKDRMTKKINEETMRIAKEKARLREEELRNEADGFYRNGMGLDRPFYPYYIEQMNKRKNVHTKAGWQNALNHLRIYEPDQTITFRRITPAWLNGFREYLMNDAYTLKDRTRKYECVQQADGRWERVVVRSEEPSRLKQNSAKDALAKVVAAINAAMTDGLLKRDPTEGVRTIPKAKTNREHLSAEEVHRLMETPCQNETAKKAFLFCCMTGLRHCDCYSLKWSDVIEENGNTYIEKRQNKTGNNVIVPLNHYALELIGHRGNPESRVFPDMVTDTHINEVISVWCVSAGIRKKITFHCARHTFACLTLQASGDIYTTSKLLGHSDIQVTQVYAKVLDESKLKAVTQLNNLI